MREGHLTSRDEQGAAGKWRYREEQETQVNSALRQGN